MSLFVQQGAAALVQLMMFLFFSFPAAKKAKKTHRPLKKQMSSPNFQRKEKPEKVRVPPHPVSVSSWRNVVYLDI